MSSSSIVRSPLKEINALTVYQNNILQILAFMQKVKNTIISLAFLNTFQEIEHKYATRFSKFNFKQPPVFINYAKFSISSWGPQFWIIVLSETEKNISNLFIFKSQIKKLLSTDNESDYF